MYVATGVYRVTVVARGHISKPLVTIVKETCVCMFRALFLARILVGMPSVFSNREHVYSTRGSLTEEN
jgi:hypothetical protein